MSRIEETLAQDEKIKGHFLKMRVAETYLYTDGEEEVKDSEGGGGNKMREWVPVVTRMK